MFQAEKSAHAMSLTFHVTVTERVIMPSKVKPQGDGSADIEKKNYRCYGDIHELLTQKNEQIANI